MTDSRDAASTAAGVEADAPRPLASTGVAGASPAGSGTPDGVPASGATAVGAVQRPEDHPRRGIAPIIRGLALYLGAAALLGLLAGAVWHAVVRLPSYTVGSDGVATTSERGLTRFFSVDAWYCGIGLVCGLLLGTASWWLFRRLGAWVTLIAVAAALVAASVALHLGESFGPSNFSARISAAHSGQHIPIDFRLHTHVCVGVWLIAADFPVLLFSALLRDADDEESRSPGWRTLGRRSRVQRSVAPAAGE